MCARNGHLLRVGPFIIARRYKYDRDPAIFSIMAAYSRLFAGHYIYSRK
jgi:hypothetical protein